jgi:hypothetical protein
MAAFFEDPRVDVDQTCIASTPAPTFSLPEE